MKNDKYPQQLTITYSYPDASPERVKEWHEQEGKWWSDRALLIVGIASFTQVFMLGMMLLSFKLIQLGVGA